MSAAKQACSMEAKPLLRLAFRPCRNNLYALTQELVAKSVFQVGLLHLPITNTACGARRRRHPVAQVAALAGFVDFSGMIAGRNGSIMLSILYVTLNKSKRKTAENALSAVSS